MTAAAYHWCRYDKNGDSSQMSAGRQIELFRTKGKYTNILILPPSTLKSGSFCKILVRALNSPHVSSQRNLQANAVHYLHIQAIESVKSPNKNWPRQECVPRQQQCWPSHSRQHVHSSHRGAPMLRPACIAPTSLCAAKIIAGLGESTRKNCH